MKISHVIRSESYINQTSKHIKIFDALNINHPLYAHIPHITDVIINY